MLCLEGADKTPPPAPSPKRRGEKKLACSPLSASGRGPGEGSVREPLLRGRGAPRPRPLDLPAPSRQSSGGDRRAGRPAAGASVPSRTKAKADLHGIVAQGRRSVPPPRHPPERHGRRAGAVAVPDPVRRDLLRDGTGGDADPAGRLA